MRNSTGWIVVFFLILIVCCGIAIWFCVKYYNHYKSWPWSDNYIEDYMLAQSNNNSLDPNTRNVLAEASKWVRVFDTLKKNNYVYSTNGKKYDMTVFRTSETADQNDSAKTPYLVVTQFLKRNFEGDVQESATPTTSRTDDNSKVKINVSSCGAIEGKENEYKCESANIGTGPVTADNAIEMFTTCGGN